MSWFEFSFKFLSALLAAALTFAAPACATDRVALVIGNSAYKNTQQLPNPRHDAEDIAAALRRVGFDAIIGVDLDKRGMDDAFRRFARAARDADTALFFYAGHALQFGGQNYLMPIDAKLADEADVPYEMAKVDDILSDIQRAKSVRVVILDACRNNPLADNLRSSLPASRSGTLARGLARIDKVEGMVLAYATQPGRTADDGGNGRNSPFTGAFLKYVDTPGLEIATLFRRVAAEVSMATEGRQLPELSVSLLGEFYFNRADSDVQAWSKVRGSNDSNALKDFLFRYPLSPLTIDARERLTTIERAAPARMELEAAERERRDRERQLFEKAEQEKRDLEAQERANQARLALEKEQRERLAREQAQTNGPSAPAADIQTAMLTPSSEPVPSVSASPPPVAGAALVREIKKELKRVACYTGALDDHWLTTETKSSLAKFAKYANAPALVAKPSVDFLDMIRSRSAPLCPLECGAREVEKNGQCIAKMCAAGLTLDADGNCSRPKDRSTKVVATPPEVTEQEKCAHNFKLCITIRTHLSGPYGTCEERLEICRRTGTWTNRFGQKL
jgi:uncharacterized caspase-like protein